MTLALTRNTLELKTTPVSSSRSVTRTLRLDEDVEAGIVAMAEREQFSFNLLANRALRKLVEWEDKAVKFGFIQVPTSIVEKVFKIISDEEARELGREAGTNTLPEMVLFWFKKFNPENTLKALEMIGSYGNAFRVQYTIDGYTDTVVLKHDRGARVSALRGTAGVPVQTHGCQSRDARNGRSGSRNDHSPTGERSQCSARFSADPQIFGG